MRGVPQIVCVVQNGDGDFEELVAMSCSNTMYVVKKSENLLLESNSATK